MIIERDLVARLEATTAQLALAVARSLTTHLGDGAERGRPFGNGCLVALGSGRYVNRAVGTTLADLDDNELDEVERFYTTRGLPPAVEVCPLAPTLLVERLAGRGYTPSWFRNVYVRPAQGADPEGADPRWSAIAHCPVDDARLAEWLSVLAAGNELETPTQRAISDEFGRAAHAVPGSMDLVAVLDGAIAGCGSLQIAEGVGWLGGAATSPAFRRRGVQQALLHHRIRLAAEQGCDMVAATALPGGASARNLERAAFLLAYTQVVLTRPTT